MSAPKSRGCEVVNLTLRIPATCATSSNKSENFIVRAVGSTYEFTVCPSNCTSEYPSSASCRTSRKIDSLPRLRSGPRVCGTTQYAQALSQPSIIVKYARQGLFRRVISVSKVSSVSLSSPATRLFPASSSASIPGNSRYLAEPHTKLTHGARLKISCPSCCATHPNTPIILSAPRSRYSPSRENTFCAAFSRMLHVLYRIIRAASGVSTCRYPRDSNNPATFSESWSFIWHPKVSRKNVPPFAVLPKLFAAATSADTTPLAKLTLPLASNFSEWTAWPMGPEERFASAPPFPLNDSTPISKALFI